MSTRNSAKNDSLRTKLIVLALIVSILLTALAIYDISKDEHSFSVWLAIICWPIVAIANCIQLYRMRRAR